MGFEGVVERGRKMSLVELVLEGLWIWEMGKRRDREIFVSKISKKCQTSLSKVDLEHASQG